MVLPKRDVQSLRTSFDRDALAALRNPNAQDARSLQSALAIVRVFVRSETRKLRLPTSYVDDLAQDVLIRVWANAQVVRADDLPGFFSWLWRIAHNVVANANRHEQRAHRIETSWPGTYRLPSSRRETERRCQVDDEMIPSNDVDPMEDAVVKERGEAVAHAIGQLTQRQRDALMRWVIQGETLAAIARRHNISKATASRDVKEALALLEDLLRRFGPSSRSRKLPKKT